MMKFFRKYTKHMLAIFMALLLVVWLGGSALSSWLRSDDSMLEEVRGEMFGQEVRFKDMQGAFGETNTLQQLGLVWQAPWVYQLMALGVRDVQSEQIRLKPLTEAEWFMLRADALKRKVYVPPEAVEEFKVQAGISPARLNAIRQRQSLEHINQAIHAFLQVQEATNLACNAIRVSEADIRQFVRDADERVRVSLLAVNASQFRDESYQPTQEEIQAHFEKYKDEPSTRAFGLKFGYKLPEAAQIEYIKIHVKALAERQDVSDEQAFRYWEQHKEQFLKPAPTTAPTTQPVPREPYETFTAAKAEVRAYLQGEAAKDAAVNLGRSLIQQLGVPWVDAPATQPGDYREPPASETGPDVYPKLVDELETKYPGVLEYARLPLLTEPELYREPEVGRARAMMGTEQQMSLGRAAFTVAGLSSRPEDRPSWSRYFRNVYETCAEPFQDSEGNVYVMRTVAARPEQPPAEIDDELRARLVRDIRDLRAYEQAKTEAQALLGRARREDLRVLFEADEKLREQLGNRALLDPAPFTRSRVWASAGMVPRVMPTAVPRVGNDPAFVDLCFSLASQPSTEPAGAKWRAAVHEQPDGRRCLVVQYRQTLPATETEYEQDRLMARVYYQINRRIELLTDWFAPDEIRARVDWQDAKNYRTEPKPDPEPETAATF